MFHNVTLLCCPRHGAGVHVHRRFEMETMFALYIMLGGLILTMPATVGTILFWGTPMVIPVLAGLGFSISPFVVAAFFHRRFAELARDAGH
jgi:Na+/H+ antiporter NhaD/arsenite permease-like protein